MARRETIIELARTLRDVNGTSRVEAGHSEAHGKPSSRVLQATDLYRAGSYALLERELDKMRLMGDPVRQLRWQFVARYIETSLPQNVHCRTKGNRIEILWDGQWQPANGKYREITTKFGEPKDPFLVDNVKYIQITRWHNHVQPAMVDQALDWLEQHLPARLWLPDWSKAA